MLRSHWGTPRGSSPQSPLGSRVIENHPWGQIQGLMKPNTTRRYSLSPCRFSSGMYRTDVSFLILWFEGCPGSGCSRILIWATLPVSKDAENPSKMVLLVQLCLLPPGDMPGHRAGSPHLLICSCMGCPGGHHGGHHGLQESPGITCGDPGGFLGLFVAA